MKYSIFKILSAIALCVLISGCHTLRSIASGGSERIVATNPDGTVATDRFGFTKYNTKTTSKSEGIFKHAAKAVENLPDEPKKDSVPCGGVTFAIIEKLSPEAQVAAFNCLAAAQSNRPLEIMGEAMMAMAGGPVSTAHAIFAEATKAVNSIQSAALGKWNAASSFGKFSVGVSAAGRTIRNGQDAQRDQSIAASENSGDTTVGDISIGGGLSNGAQSNDGGSSGELGTGGGGEGTSSNSSETGTTIVNIGDDNNTSISSDQGRSFAGTSATQQVDSSGTGMLINDSNVDQPNAIDENNGDLSNQPQNGENSLLDL